MKQNEKIASALNEADVHRRICEAEIGLSIGRFISGTGLRPTSASFYIIEVSHIDSRTREFTCSGARLSYESDVRFLSPNL